MNILQRLIDRTISMNILQRLKDRTIFMNILQRLKDRTISMNILQRLKDRTISMNILQRLKDRTISMNILQRLKDRIRSLTEPWNRGATDGRNVAITHAHSPPPPPPHTHTHTQTHIRTVRLRRGTNKTLCNIPVISFSRVMSQAVNSFMTWKRNKNNLSCLYDGNKTVMNICNYMFKICRTITINKYKSGIHGTRFFFQALSRRTSCC